MYDMYVLSNFILVSPPLLNIILRYLYLFSRLTVHQNTSSITDPYNAFLMEEVRSRDECNEYDEELVLEARQNEEETRKRRQATRGLKIRWGRKMKMVVMCKVLAMSVQYMKKT